MKKKIIFGVLVAGIVVVFILALGIPCIIVKTGMPKVSRDINESKEKNMFLFEMQPNKKHIIIDSLNSFDFGEIWVEHDWEYECNFGVPVSKKRNYKQLIFEIINKQGDFDDCKYYLMETDFSKGIPLCSRPDFHYDETGTFTVVLAYQNDTDYNWHEIDTIYFTRK